MEQGGIYIIYNRFTKIEFLLKKYTRVINDV
jgi:hypothetical protein